MKVYTDCRNFIYSKTKINASFRTSQVVLKNAFGSLKVRFHCLSKNCDASAETESGIISAWCVLPNMCKMKNQEFLKEWLRYIDLDITENVADGQTYCIRRLSKGIWKQKAKKILLHDCHFFIVYLL